MVLIINQFKWFSSQNKDSINLLSCFLFSTLTLKFNNQLLLSVAHFLPETSSKLSTLTISCYLLRFPICFIFCVLKEGGDNPCFWGGMLVVPLRGKSSRVWYHLRGPEKISQSIQFWSGFIPINGNGLIYPTLTAISPTTTLHLTRFMASSFSKTTLLLSFSTCVFHVFFGHPRFLLPSIQTPMLF